MTTFATGLWKEWRDHRATSLGFAVATPCLAALAFATLPGRWASDSMILSMVATTAGFAGFAIAALAIGSDLAAGEAQRGRDSFLLRLPAGLPAAFLSKLAFYVLVLGGFASWAFASTAVAAFLFNGAEVWPRVDVREAGAYGPAALAAASWVLAGSCWLRRGTFVVPATAVAIAAGLAPMLLIFEGGGGVRARGDEMALALLWLASTGLVAATVAFVHGGRFGGDRGRRLVSIAAPLLLAFAPLWIWADRCVQGFRHVDPKDSTFRIEPVALGPDGRFAFVNACNLRPVPWEVPGGREQSHAFHALVVDLESGAWHELGEPDDRFDVAGPRVDPSLPKQVFLVDPDGGEGGGLRTKAVLDSRTANALEGDATGPSLSETGRLLGLGSWGRFTFLADGRRAWAERYAVFVDSTDGPREVATTADRWWTPRGHGFVTANLAVDLTRERTFDLRDRDVAIELIRAGRWIVQRGRSQRFAPMLWDPETDAFSPLQGVGDPSTFWVDRELLGLHRDGRLLVLFGVPRKNNRGIRGRLALVDPETGAAENLLLPAELASGIAHGSSRGFTPEGDWLLQLQWWSCDHTWFARLDPRTNELVCIGPFDDPRGYVLGAPDRDTLVFVEKERRIVRAHFDGRSPEFLFPR